MWSLYQSCWLFYNDNNMVSVLIDSFYDAVNLLRSSFVTLRQDDWSWFCYLFMVKGVLPFDCSINNFSTAEYPLCRSNPTPETFEAKHSCLNFTLLILKVNLLHSVLMNFLSLTVCIYLSFRHILLEASRILFEITELYMFNLHAIIIVFSSID